MYAAMAVLLETAAVLSPPFEQIRAVRLRITLHVCPAALKHLRKTQRCLFVGGSPGSKLAATWRHGLHTLLLPEGGCSCSAHHSYF